MNTLTLRVNTSEGPAILIAPLVDLIKLRAQHWHMQEIADLAAGQQRYADLCRAKATVLEQLAHDVAEQR